MKKYLPVVIVLGVILFVLTFPTYGEPQQSDVLDDSIWKIIDLNGEPLVKGTTLTIRFHNHKVSGSSGCNRFSGRYRVDADSITIIIKQETTKNYPTPDVLRQEDAFKRYLLDVSSFIMEGQVLTHLTEQGGAIIFSSLLSKQAYEKSIKKRRYRLAYWNGLETGFLTDDSRNLLCVKDMLHHLNIGAAQKLQRVIIDTIRDVIHQPGNAGVDQRLGAIDTWEVCDVAGAAPR